MADKETLLLSGSAEKQLNKVHRRKIRLSECKDSKNKALRNAGKPYRNRKGTFVPGKCVSEKVTVCRCMYECDNISKDMKTKLFQDFYKRTYNEPGTYNRQRAVSFDVKELVRDHIDSMPAQESNYSRSTSSKRYLSSELCVERMYDLFKESRFNIKSSHGLHRDIFRSEFKLRFGPPRSESCSYCDELYINLVTAETEDEQKRISVQSTLHHRKAETAYKVLHKDVVMSKSNPTYVVLCTNMQQKYFTTIDQKFLVSGHSFLPCTRYFALIERKNKKSTVYHPKQWLEVIVNANMAFSAYYMDKEDFIDLSAIEGMFKK
ncbi:hypothetical protein PR048_001520 [Dryococelus australis]|uniref:Uncharacterized protein n=1 Tax=Dryococelus australis TaxID=614101 RepID=A0ABQ9IHK8_9NEOP|nr:hypothetical protein PR048_001520 [Dryococelus australis]